MKTFTSLLQDPVLGTDACLWRGICVRISGGDAFHEFKRILAMDSNNRLALVNLAANCLTRYSTSHMYDASDRPIVLSRLQEHLELHPNDVFARLLEALFQVGPPCFKPDAALEKIENRHLIAPNYSPGISVMAILLDHSLLTESAQDYAREAMRKDPWNFQAIGIARYLGITEG